MAREFRHYIITRYNVGVFDPNVRKGSILRDVDAYMQHRFALFSTITVPSIMAQVCQNFTWLVLIDPWTSPTYREPLEKIAALYPRMKLIPTEGYGLDNPIIADAALKQIEPGDYDLITTRLDNDDALHIHAVHMIQYWYAPRPEAWAMMFSSGLMLDLAQMQLYPMVYHCNNCPTLIEPRAKAQTVFCTSHAELPVKARELITGNCYWLIAAHAKNVANNVDEQSPAKMIFKDNPIPLDNLKAFNIRQDHLTALASIQQKLFATSL